MLLRSLMLPALLLTLAACADRGSFPSLAPRSVEKESPDVAPPPPAPVASDPRLAALLAELLGRAREGQTAFQAELAAAVRAASAAGAAGSEPWIEAQQAISRLEAARAPTVTARTEIDALLLARNGEGAPTNDQDLAALRSAVAEVQAIEEGQEREIDRLAGSLASI